MSNKLNFKKMKTANKLFLVLMVLPFVFISCGNSIAKQMKEEMQTLKSQCPQYQGDGITMTDVNFYEREKILEYVCSIDGVDASVFEAMKDEMVEIMKEAMVEALNNDLSTLEKFSIKTVVKRYDYRLRYIYTDTEGNILCEIEISKHDL